MKKQLKWSEIETSVFEYIKSKGINLSLAQFRNPRGGASGLKYVGPSWQRLARLDPAWIPSTTSDPMDYDDTLWRGVNAWASFCTMVRARQDDNLTCEQFCDKWMAA